MCSLHGHPNDEVSYEALNNIEGIELKPNMSRRFGPDEITHVAEVVLPTAIRGGDLSLARDCEKVLARYGYARPNAVSGLWEPLETPKNEVQVRELFAMKLSEFGYRLVCSQEGYPDWLLVSEGGQYVYTEVEHRSSSFATHGHDPAYCDLIVCWEHDWPAAVVDVLELFSGRTFPATKMVESKPRHALGVNFAGMLMRHARDKVTVASVSRQSGKNGGAKTVRKAMVEAVEERVAEGDKESAAALEVSRLFGVPFKVVQSHYNRGAC